MDVVCRFRASVIDERLLPGVGAARASLGIEAAPSC
jgi:hypothetical protein